MTQQGRYPAQMRERAVRMVFEHQGEHATQWAATTSIAEKFGVSSETLRLSHAARRDRRRSARRADQHRAPAHEGAGGRGA